MYSVNSWKITSRQCVSAQVESYSEIHASQWFLHFKLRPTASEDNNKPTTVPGSFNLTGSAASSKFVWNFAHVFSWHFDRVDETWRCEKQTFYLLFYCSACRFSHRHSSIDCPVFSFCCYRHAMHRQLQDVRPLDVAKGRTNEKHVRNVKLTLVVKATWYLQCAWYIRTSCCKLRRMVWKLQLIISRKRILTAACWHNGIYCICDFATKRQSFWCIAPQNPL